MLIYRRQIHWGQGVKPPGTNLQKPGCYDNWRIGTEIWLRNPVSFPQFLIIPGFAVTLAEKINP
ncbi:MAG TPA: hypothetical protein IGS52_21585 [Oscillatoriaceae cyanobacterium M33_DOE_052]|nr:hypothetical protein [Oscillatoriaceae cyanobacterium M33_DOE_052]